MSKETNPYVKISPQLQEAAQQHKGDIKGALLKELELAYHEITGKVLTVGCSSCLSTGLKIVNNYIAMFPQSSAATPKKNTKVERVNTAERWENPVDKMPELVDSDETAEEINAGLQENKWQPMTFPDQRPDNMLKLRELRVKYPQIKARSVTGFIKDLEEWKASQ